MTHYKLGSQVYSYAASDENSGCKTCSDKELKKLETIAAWQMEKVKSKKEVILEAQRDRESPLCFTDGHVSSEECGVRTKITKIQRQSRALGEAYVKDDSQFLLNRARLRPR